MFLDEDGNFKYASGSAKDIAGGLDTQKNKDNIEKYNSGKNNFLRLIALSDIILSKAADPNFAKATGFYSRFGDFLLGVQKKIVQIFRLNNILLETQNCLKSRKKSTLD